MPPVGGSPTTPPGAAAWVGRGMELLHTCQKWRLRTNPCPCILLACAGGRVQRNQRTTFASASRGSQRFCAPAGLGARTPTAEVIDQKADSRVTSVCNLLTSTLVPTVRRNVLVGVEVVEEVAIEDTVELM